MWKANGHDEDEAERVEAKTRELEGRAATVARRLREQDPWASRVLDAIHQRPGEPHVR